MRTIFQLLKIMTRKNIHCVLSNGKSKLYIIHLGRGIKIVWEGNLVQAVFGPPLSQIRIGLGPGTIPTKRYRIHIACVSLVYQFVREHLSLCWAQYVFFCSAYVLMALLRKEAPKSSLILPSCEDTAKRWLAMNQESGSHQT